MTDAPTTPAPEQPPQVRAICGFWRRVAAFILDSFVLGIFGFFLGLAFYSDFARMGGSGRWVGFAIALAYFAVLNSSAAGGQTVGKRIMKIEVVDRTGGHISLARSAVRYAVLGSPFFLNGAPIGADHKVLLVAALSAVFWMGPSIFYLYVFNHRTRQSLHDLAVGTYVVQSQGHGAPAVGTIWRPHLYVVGLFAVGALLCIPLARWVAKAAVFADLANVQAKIASSGEFYNVGVNKGVSVTFESGASRTTKTLSVTASVMSLASLSGSEARKAASFVLSNYPGVKDEDRIKVTLRYGYDIGISTSSVTRNFEHSPAEWGQMLSVGP